MADLTKEEIIDKHIKSSHGLNIHSRLYKNLIDAMQEYADQEAKSYASWLATQVYGGRTASKLFKDYKEAIGELQ